MTAVRDGAEGSREEQLEALSTGELRSRAVHRAERHWDVKFFWSLLEFIPSAEATSGDVVEADFDIESSKSLIFDAVHSGDGKLGAALRPVFIDYLLKHPDKDTDEHPDEHSDDKHPDA